MPGSTQTNSKVGSTYLVDSEILKVNQRQISLPVVFMNQFYSQSQLGLQKTLKRKWLHLMKSQMCQKQGNSTGPHVHKELTLDLMFCCHHLEILNIFFESGALPCHFALGPTSYVASPVHKPYVCFSQMKSQVLFLKSCP